MVNKALSQGIKSQSWVAIEYLNNNNETTNYWIAIHDIDIKNKKLKVDAFNVNKISPKHNGVIEITINYDNIKSATLLKNTKYNQNELLIPKIESNLEELKWLEFDTFSNEVLDYILECMIHEETPYQRETTLVKGLDQDSFNNLKQNEQIILTHEQIADLVPKIEKLSNNDKKHYYEIVTLALNMLSISTKNGLFVVAYKNLYFDPVRKSLEPSNNINFNYTFKSNEDKLYRHNLRNYLDIDTEYFLELFLKSPEQAKKLLEPEVLKYNESLDDRPYIMDLVTEFNAHIEREFDLIKRRYKYNSLSTPLKAFFGNMTGSFLSGRTRKVDLVVLDNRANIDQLRVIYNALTKPITYVQGPPGTGKTHTIINTLISSFFNEDKVLVSSNNNKPINDIYEKINSIKSHGKKMYLPFIRLGNKEETIKSLNYIKDNIDIINKYQIKPELLNNHARNSVQEMKQINELISNYETRIELEEELEVLTTMKEKLKLDLRSVVVSEMINKKTKELIQTPVVRDDDVKKYIKKADNKFFQWLFFTGIKHYKKLFEPKNEPLLNIIKAEDDDEKFTSFTNYIKDDKNFNNFQKIFPIILTTNQSAHRLGLQNELFDLVIIDEAGQSSIGYALFPISRAKRLLLVGDQNQLKPVITMAEEDNNILMNKYNINNDYNYLENSILLTMQKVDTVSKFVLLRYHYRSSKDIINFSNYKYYNEQLIIETLANNLDKNALELINVNTKQEYTPVEKNTSILEIDAILQDIKNKQYENVGIITPFRNQANLITELLDENLKEKVSVGTIHTFQGDEKDVIYFSTGISNKTHSKSFDWVKNNQELINVATTRAKRKFILVTDVDELKIRSSVRNDLFELYNYILARGNPINLTKSNRTYFINGANFKNYDTKKEQEFFETIKHLLSTGDKYELRKKVRIASILGKFITNDKFSYALKGEFDLVIFRRVGPHQIPVVAIELDGSEHKIDPKVIKRDQIKEEICKDNNIRLIRIDNKYSRRYLYIKDLLKDILV